MAIGIATPKLNQPGYLRPLDGLRAVAVLFVVFFHSPFPAFQLPFGWAGVNLFFILSGFLITRILMALKRAPLNAYLSSFYGRRARRILPLYFLYLLLSAVLLNGLNGVFHGSEPMVQQGISDLKKNYIYLLTGTYNLEEIVNFLYGRSYLKSVFYGHLWTLSLELQFYLLFPLLVYFLSPSRLRNLLIVLLILIPFARLITVLWLLHRVNDVFFIGWVLYESTPFQLDTLALGALLALCGTDKKPQTLLLGGGVLLMLVVGWVHIGFAGRYHLDLPARSLGYDNPVFHLLHSPPYHWLDHRYFYSIPLINLVFGVTLLLVSEGKLLKPLMESRWLVAIGKVSYGIYIYHLAFSYIFELTLRSLSGKAAADLPLALDLPLMVLYLLALYLLAWFSYRFFESRWLPQRTHPLINQLSR